MTEHLKEFVLEIGVGETGDNWIRKKRETGLATREMGQAILELISHLIGGRPVMIEANQNQSVGGIGYKIINCDDCAAHKVYTKTAMEFSLRTIYDGDLQQKILGSLRSLGECETLSIKTMRVR